MQPRSTPPPSPQAQPLSSCRRRRHHRPIKPSAGPCAACLAERLADQLQRSKSYCESRGDSGPGPTNCAEPSRRSCGAVAKNSLADLFGSDDEPKARGEEMLRRARGKDGEEFEGRGGGDELRTMKEFIDLEWRSKRCKDKEARGFWGIASVLSEKVRKWKWMKQRNKRRDGESGDVDLGKGTEVGECRMQRRSCDLAFESDGRRAFDDPIEGHRASLDGHLTGRSSGYSKMKPVISVLSRVNSVGILSENGMLVEDKLNIMEKNDKGSDRSFQASDCYQEPSASLQRPRGSCGRSNLRWKGMPESENDETKPVPRLKQPPGATELFCGSKLHITEQELMDWRLKTVGDDDLITLKSALQNAAPAPAIPVAGTGKQDQKQYKLQLHRWQKAWNIWSLMHTESQSKDADPGLGCIAGNFDGRVVAKSCQEPENVTNEKKAISKLNHGLTRTNSVSGGSISLQSSLHKFGRVNGQQRFNLAPLRSYRSKTERM